MPARLSFIAAPALEVTQPVVETSVPAVEAVLLQNDASGKQAVTLMNWAYRARPQRPGPDGKPAGAVENVELKDLKVVIRPVGRIDNPSGAARPVAKITSAMLDKELPVRRVGEAIEVVLPRIEEGDVLILE